MCRDNLLPERFGRTHERFGTPHKITPITMVVVAATAGFVPLSTLAELVNIGTLFAFMLVAAGVLYLRAAEPERERPFRTPLAPVLPVLAIAGCAYLAVTLPAATWLRFGVDGARPGRLRGVCTAGEHGGCGARVRKSRNLRQIRPSAGASCAVGCPRSRKVPRGPELELADGSGEGQRQG